MVWVLHEVAKSRDVVLPIWKQDWVSIPWLSFHTFQRGLSRCSNDHMHQIHGAWAPQNPSCLSGICVRRNSPIEFRHIRGLARGFGATAGRDKIYALGSLATDVPDDTLIPDFSMPVHQFFRGVVRFNISSYQSLKCICYNTRANLVETSEV
jgi:hypothetical protein